MRQEVACKIFLIFSKTRILLNFIYLPEILTCEILTFSILTSCSYHFFMFFIVFSTVLLNLSILTLYTYLL